MADQNYQDMQSAAFEKQRQQAIQAANVAKQTGQDALSRRFSTLNAGGSGAAISAGLKNQEMAANLGRQGVEDVNARELQANLANQQVKEVQAFQAAESEKGRAFGAGESAIGRKFAEQQNLASQQFTGAQNLASQQFAGQQSQLGREQAGQLSSQDLAFKKEALAADAANKLAQMDEARKEFELNKQISQFNQDLARAQTPALGLQPGEMKDLKDLIESLRAQNKPPQVLYPAYANNQG